MRNIGTAFGHCLIAYTAIAEGLQRIRLDERACLKALEENPQVVVEALQVMLKREGMADAYEQLLAFTRGKTIGRSEIDEFIQALDVSQKLKKDLLAITPRTYLGLAKSLK